MSGSLRGGLIARWSYVLTVLVRRHRPVGAKDHLAPKSRRPVRSGRTIALVILPLLFLFIHAPPIPADTYTWTGPGDLAVNKTGTGGNDTFTFNNFNFDDFITGSLDGGGGTDTLNLGQGGWFQATLSNFESLVKSGDFSQKTTLDTDLSVNSFTQTEGLTYVYETLTTGTATIQNGSIYFISSSTFNATVLDVQDGASMSIYGTGPAALTVTVGGYLGVSEGGTMSALNTSTNDGKIGVYGTYNYGTFTVGDEGLGAYSLNVEGQSSDGVNRSGGFLSGASIIIQNNGDMWVEGGVVTATTIEIQSGGLLRIEDVWAGGGRFYGTVNADTITVQSGGRLNLQYGGVLNLTSALNMPAGAWSLDLQGDITINGGAGTITGDGAVQSLTIGGVFNANASLGGGNDTVTINSNGINGTLNGGDGTDTLVLSGGTLSTTTQNFEILTANAGTLATNLNLGASGTATVTSTGGLTVANGGTLTTNSLEFHSWALVSVDAGGVINTATLNAGHNSQFDIAGTVTVTTSTIVGAWSGKIIVKNGGTFSGAATTIGSDNAYIRVENGGTFNATTTIIGTSGSYIRVDAGGAFNYDTLQVNGGGIFNLYGQATAATSTTIDGTVTVTNGGTLGGAATTINSGGVVSVNTGGAFNYSTLNLQAGGTFTIDGTATATTSTLVAGTVNLNNGGTLNAQATTVNNGVTLTVNTGGAFNYSTLNLQAGATLAVSGTATATTSTTIAGTVNVNNGGTLNGQATTIDNNMTMTIATGGAFNYTTVTVNAGSTLDVSGTATATTSTTLAGAATINNGGALTGQATTINNGGGLAVNAGGTFNATTLVVAGGGAFVLTGDANPTTSTTVSGTAIVNGTLTSPTVTVGATGGLAGAGQITGNLTNNGRVGPGNSIGTLNVTGNYAQGAGATLQVEINANGTNDLLHATGTANLAGTLAIATTGTYTGTNQHVVLQADGGITGTFDTVTGLAGGNTLRHKFGVSYTTTQVLVDITVVTYESLVRGYGGRPVCVAKCLDTIANTATGDMANIINQLDHLPDVASLVAAFRQLHCGRYHAFKTVNFNTQHLFVALSQSRLFQLRTGVAVTGTTAGFSNPSVGPLVAYSGNLGQLGRLLSSDATTQALQGEAVFAGPPGEVLRTAYAGRRLGLWVRPFGIIEDQDTVGGSAGYNFTTTGFAAGFDYRFAPNFIAGVSLGYATSRVKYDDAGGSSGDVQNYTAGVYGTWFGPRWFVEFSLSYAANSFDMNRKIKFGGVDRTASSDYRGFALTAQVGGGYDFPLGRSWTIGPVCSLEAVHQEQESFTESGAGALNLTLGRRSATSVRGAVGVRVRRVFRWRGGRRLTLSLSALWVHEFANNAQGVNASLQGNPATPFTVSTPEPERDAVRLGIGITARVSRRVSLFAAYQPEFRKDNQSHYVSAGVRIEF